MDTKHNLGIILTLFIMLILGLVLLTSTSDTIDLITQSQVQTNESDAVNLLWVNGTNMTLDYGNVSVSEVRNCTDATVIASTDYTVYATVGRIQANVRGNESHGGAIDNTAVCVDYSYTPADYIANSTTRTLINLIILFFALGIFGGAIGYSWKILKDNGVI